MSRSNDLHHDDWEGLVVICAGSAWDLWYPAEKHIAALLSRHTPVLYVDPPSPPTSGRFEGLRILNRGLAVLSPRGIPGLTRPILRNAQSVITRRAIARAVQSLGVKRALALVVANHLDLFNAVDADQRIMFATDNFVSGANLMGLDHRYLLAEEKKQAARADRIIVVTERLGDHWRVRGHNPILIPNGCDTERFSTTDCSPWPHDVDLPRPIAGVFGHLSERIDLDLLEAVAERGHSLLLVGTKHPSFALDRLLVRGNVRYLGPKPFEAMPSYLRAIDIGLTPYAVTEFNCASFPLKTLEYLAAGRQAVSTDLPATKWLNTELIGVACKPSEFADLVDTFMRRPRTARLVQECHAFARRHSWTERAKAFGGVLGLWEMSSA